MPVPPIMQIWRHYSIVSRGCPTRHVDASRTLFRRPARTAFLCSTATLYHDVDGVRRLQVVVHYHLGLYSGAVRTINTFAGNGEYTSLLDLKVSTARTHFAGRPSFLVTYRKCQQTVPVNRFAEFSRFFFIRKKIKTRRNQIGFDR
jgi:hypothetical protein